MSLKVSVNSRSVKGTPGDGYLDDNNIIRVAPCKIGDIIVHTYTGDSGEVEFKEYRFVRFYTVLGVLK